MTRYRVYLLDDGGHILRREELKAESDAAAITAGWDVVSQSKGSQPVVGVELWDARRLVFSTHPRRG